MVIVAGIMYNLGRPDIDQCSISGFIFITHQAESVKGRVINY